MYLRRHLMHLSFASPWLTPGHLRRTLRHPGVMVQFWYFFFSRKGGELFSFGNDFAGLWGHTHGICSRQCYRQGEKCFTVKHRLSGLVGTGLNGPDNRKSGQSKIWILMSQDPYEISLSNRANLNQSKLSKMYCVSSYGACEQETRSGVCFEAKQIRFA